MTQTITIPQIIDCILKNLGAVNSTGLYNGKAGLSLSLFVASGHLHDDNLEYRAYDLLQESLIIKNNNLNFENGQAGIGYALLYLVDNNYLKVNFDEVFGKQYEEIIKGFEHIEKYPLKLVNSLQLIYFLSRVSSIKEDKRIQEVIKKIFEGLEFFLTLQYYDLTDIHYINRKTDVLNIYKTYLNLVDYSGYAHFSRTLLDDYAVLYRKGKIISSLETGYYLKKITDRYNIKGYEDVINENICNGTKGIYPCTLLLKERIDTVKLTGDRAYEIPANMSIRNLLKTVDKNSYPLGYGAGLGRLLIYLIDKDIELL